jgi:GNAT superfamily N-acetyltransferase
VSSPEPAPLPSDLELRPLVPKHATAIVVLIAACDRTYLEWAPSGWSPPPEEAGIAKWEARLAEADRWARGAFESSGRLAAMAAARPAKTQDGVPIEARGRLGALFVDPTRWQEGIGVALLRRAEHAMRDLGCESATLETPESAPARAFYERHGWNPKGGREFKDDLGMWMVEYETSLAAPDTGLT